ncbi:MAG: hypothetical protein Q4D96_03975 [Propionibacteriaceae bacterium]|nr:hypothetical protein [Propionibacteriaceae bacterium]
MVFVVGAPLTILIIVIIVFYLRFLLWMLLAPDQALVFIVGMAVGVSWIGPSLTSDSWGILVWGLGTGVLVSAVYITLLILLHKSFPRISRIVNFVLMVPLTGICVHGLVTKDFANSLPRLADEPAMNSGVYAVIAALIGLALWGRRMKKLDFWQWRALGA